MKDFPHERIGLVTSGEMLMNGDFWGTIDWWQEQYDSAIENHLSKEEAGSALSLNLISGSQFSHISYRCSRLYRQLYGWLSESKRL